MWRVYTRGTITPHVMDIPFRSMRELGPTINLTPINTILYLNRGDKLWWCWREDEMTALGTELLVLARDTKARDQHLKLLDGYYERAFKAAQVVLAKDLTSCPDSEIENLYDYIYEESKEAHASTNGEIDAIDAFVTEHFQALLLKALEKESDLPKRQEVILALSTPAYLSYISKEEIELLKILIGEQGGWGEAKVADALKKVWSEYAWTSLGWEKMETKTLADFQNSYLKLKESITDPAEKLKVLEFHPEEIREKRKVLIARYNLSPEILSLIDFFDAYARYHDLRKEMQMKTVYAAHTLLREVAKRRNLNPDDLDWFLQSEVREILRGKELDQAELEKRRRAICVLYNKPDLLIYSGAEAEKIFDQELTVKVEADLEITGMAAARGRVRGIVKICNGVADALRKVEEGDILVTGMTLPDYVPAMKRAAAIVTDEGGITCHAAIVSRELKKPCIIGTRIATQVLKDGDLVEVDAEKGVVKIIKRNG